MPHHHAMNVKTIAISVKACKLSQDIQKIVSEYYQEIEKCNWKLLFRCFMCFLKNCYRMGIGSGFQFTFFCTFPYMYLNWCGLQS